MKIINYKKCENFINKINNVIEFCNKLLLITLFIMLVCICSKELIKNILITIGLNNEIVKIIADFLYLLIRLFIKIFIVYVIILFFYFIIKKLYIFMYIRNQKNRYKEMLKSANMDQNIKELYKNIYNYFSNKSNNIPIFISGEWGAGKTYTVNNFLNKYYKYSKQNIYKISCFGITTKEALMKRISEACENEDKSIFNQIILLIGEIPIVGVFLKNILEKKYDINNIRSNSIFIFDNFERIEWTKYGKNTGTVRINYENAICKYDIVVGIIDELIEKYKMKVIIIGNELEMVPNYLYDTFICKLGCKKYTIIPKAVVFENIWHEILDKIIIDKAYIESFMNILEEVKIASEIIWKMSNKNNIRILYKTIYNYITLIVILKENNYEFDEKINEIISIYYTNFIINLYDDYEVQEFKEYESIGLHYEKEAVRHKNTKYLGLTTINAMWCSNKELFKLWRNLEQSNYEIKEKLEIYKRKYKSSYISKKNCISEQLDIEKIDIEDLICLLTCAKNEFKNNAIKLLNKKAIKYESIDGIANIINNYNAEELFRNDEELLLSFFKYLYDDPGIKDNLERLSRGYESFKKCNELYKETIKKNKY